MTGTDTSSMEHGASLGQLASDLRRLGAHYDALPGFPDASLTLLVAHGCHQRFAPVSAGGMPFVDRIERNRSMDRALRFVGGCDLSVGRLFEGHVNAMLLFERHALPEQNRWLRQQLERGAWFGVWASEPSPGVRLGLTAQGRQLSGAKFFASGAGGLDYAVVTAASDEGDRQLVIVPAADAARTDVSGWRVRGMRASVSGTYDLSGLNVDRAMILGGPGDYDREPDFTAGAWRFCSVQLGGIEALMEETRQQLRPQMSADPVARARFADAVVAVRSAGYWVTEAARLAATEEKSAITHVRLTRGVVERAGLDAMEAAARLLGTRSSFDGNSADKLIRDLSMYLRQAGPDHARDEAAKILIAEPLVSGCEPW